MAVKLKDLKAPARPDLAARMGEVKNGGGTLSQVTDELNRKLALVERALVRLQLGVVASTHFLGDFAEPEPQTLTFAKRHTGWGLFVEAGNEVFPLLNASRELRLKAVDVLPTLIEELLKRTDEETLLVRSRMQKLDDLLATFGPDALAEEASPSTDDESPF